MKRWFLLLVSLFALPLFAADAEAPVAPPPTTASSGGPTRLFQIVLVRGAISGPEELVGIPKNAEKAIRDVHDFLPFKSYKLLDSGLMRVGDTGGKIRLEGVSPQQYDVRVAWKPGAANKLAIWDFAVVPVRLPGTTPLPKGVAPEAERPVIDTSFTVDPGETVVVGSSRLGGDVALIVLFTAIPNK